MSETVQCANGNGFADDILQPLSLDRLSEYRKVCEKRAPWALCAHHFLLLHERWLPFFNAPENQKAFQNVCEKCKYHFYAPRNSDINNCTFIAITEGATDDDVSLAVKFIALSNRIIYLISLSIPFPLQINRLRLKTIVNSRPLKTVDLLKTVLFCFQRSTVQRR